MQQGGHDTAINPATRPHDTVKRHATRPPWRAWPGCWVCRQTGHDTAMRYGRGEATTRLSGPVTRSRGPARRPGRRCDTARPCALDNKRDSAQHGLRHGRCALRHDQGEATIQPGAKPRHGATWPAQRAAWAMGVHTMHLTKF